MGAWLKPLGQPHIYLSSDFSPGEIWRWMKHTGCIKVTSKLKPIIVSFDITCGPKSHYSSFPFKVHIKAGEDISGEINFTECEQTYSVAIPIKASFKSSTIKLESDQCFTTPKLGRNKSPIEWSARISNLQWKILPNDQLASIFISYKYSRLDPPRFNFLSNSLPSLIDPSLAQFFPPRNCPLCNKNHLPAEAIGKLTPTRNLGEVSFQLVHCNECDLIYQTPLPHHEMLRYIYTSTTQFDGHESYSGENAANTIAYFQDRLSKILNAYQFNENNIKLLEVGCGLSWMARALKSKTSQCLTVGQDISGEASEICSWVDHYIVGGLHEQLKQIGKYGPFQLISMTHVIEHVQDPISILTLCRELLDSKGVIFITAPHRPIGWKDNNYSFDLWNNWDLNHVPAHLQYFNQKSISICAQSSGMNVKFFTDKPSEGQSFEAWLDKDSRPLFSEVPLPLT